jgi:hypothetical protein
VTAAGNQIISSKIGGGSAATGSKNLNRRKSLTKSQIKPAA